MRRIMTGGLVSGCVALTLALAPVAAQASTTKTASCAKNLTLLPALGCTTATLACPIAAAGSHAIYECSYSASETAQGVAAAGLSGGVKEGGLTGFDTGYTYPWNSAVQPLTCNPSGGLAKCQANTGNVITYGSTDDGEFFGFTERVEGSASCSITTKQASLLDKLTCTLTETISFFQY